VDARDKFTLRPAFGRTGVRGHDAEIMKTTRYFEEQVLRKRPYIERDWCRLVLRAPIRREIQDDGRLRVVTLEDGETVHNAFFDRNFREDQR